MLALHPAEKFSNHFRPPLATVIAAMRVLGELDCEQPCLFYKFNSVTIFIKCRLVLYSVSKLNFILATWTSSRSNLPLRVGAALE